MSKKFQSMPPVRAGRQEIQEVPRQRADRGEDATPPHAGDVRRGLHCVHGRKREFGESSFRQRSARILDRHAGHPSRLREGSPRRWCGMPVDRRAERTARERARLSGIDKIGDKLGYLFGGTGAQFLFTKIDKLHFAGAKFADTLLDSGTNNA